MRTEGRLVDELAIITRRVLTEGLFAEVQPGNVVLRFAEAVPFAGTRGLGIKTVVLIKIERDGETVRGNLGTAPLDREGYCFKGDARRLDGATFNRD